MKKYYIIIFILIIILLSASGIIWFNNYNNRIHNQISGYLKTIEKVEREFIVSFPIYEDYFSPEKEKRLRKFLIQKHLSFVKTRKIKPVTKDDEIILKAESGEFVKLPADTDDLYYFYNVPEKYRYLNTKAAAGLEMLTKRIQENIKKRKDLPAVKIAISSAVRPYEYQKKLITRNINASIMSTHKYGISFDVFYDDFYISLPEADAGNSKTNALLEKIRRKFGFILGDSLRRQLRSILTESLLQLQDEKILYVIHEKYQRCYHVTIIL
ncbi:MAG: hypothetical protein JW864_07915 [Spirochaetes bacterium]|nr:hypothetical protein [Spirochaetota bacterium]